MATVLILGASGLIGSTVAATFTKEGYQVFGLTQHAEKANQLAKNEVTPVIGKAQDVSSWMKYAEKADIIIECIGDFTDFSTGGVVAAALAKLLQSHKEKVVIYTSGVWVFGNSNGQTFTDSTPLNPIPLVAYRPALEKQYTDVGGIVLRPANIYGKNSSLLGNFFFKAVAEHKTSVPGTGSNAWSLVHVDDAAQAYLLAVQKANFIRGQIFNLVSHSERVSDIVDATARLIGFNQPITYAPAQDPFTEALCLNQRFNCMKAKSILGWNPKRSPVVDEIGTYFNAWKASTQ